MSIIFFGTPEFAVPSLEAIHSSSEDISLVVTQHDKKKGRGHALASPEVKTAALRRSLAVMQPLTIRDPFFTEKISSLSPEFIVVVAYGKILPAEILRIPKHGCINVHASLLPRYRGAAPVAWALLRGETKTGVTTMLMDEGLDTGDILLQEITLIDTEDTTESLSKKLAISGSTLLLKTLAGIRNGTLFPKVQSGEPSYAPPLKKEDGMINWSRNAEELFHFVRGMHPWPGAYCTIGGERIVFLKVKPLPGAGIPGAIVQANRNNLIIAAGKGLVSIIMLQPSGKKPMTASAFLTGRNIPEGTRIS